MQYEAPAIESKTDVKGLMTHKGHRDGGGGYR